MKIPKEIQDIAYACFETGVKEGYALAMNVLINSQKTISINKNILDQALLNFLASKHKDWNNPKL